MAGRDASTQLGGMLSQIGNTLASRGSAGQGLMSPIRNTCRPALDPNDPASLQQMARFKERIGEVDQARMFTEQARYQADEQRRVQAEQQAEARLPASPQIARLQTRADEILANPQISDQQKELALQGLQNAINTLGEGAGVNPSTYVGLMNDAANRNIATKLQSLNLDSAEQRTMQSEAVENIARLEAELSGLEPGTPEFAEKVVQIESIGREAYLPRQQYMDPAGRLAAEQRALRADAARDEAVLREMAVRDEMDKLLKIAPGSRSTALEAARESGPAGAAAAQTVSEIEDAYNLRVTRAGEIAARTGPMSDEDFNSLTEGLPDQQVEGLRRLRASAVAPGAFRDTLEKVAIEAATRTAEEAGQDQLRVSDQTAVVRAVVKSLGEGTDDLDSSGFIFDTLQDVAGELDDDALQAIRGRVLDAYGVDAQFTRAQVRYQTLKYLEDRGESVSKDTLQKYEPSAGAVAFGDL